MIVDNFENYKLYINLNKRFEKAFEYMSSKDFSNVSVGCYEIDGEYIYANVDEYITKTVSNVEYHKKYIDIQFLVSGSELIGFCPYKNMKFTKDYDDSKDVGFGEGKVDFIKLLPGMFVILFPQDGHQPCMAIKNPQKVKKVVVKVRVD